MTEEGDVGVTVSLDGVYYHQAKRMIGSADAADKEFERWEKYLTGANAKAEELEDDPAREDDLHDLCVEIDRHWQSVDQSATELIREVAAIHMLCAASLEAHINIRAENLLATKIWSEFDKLTVTGKWLFYPRLTEVGAFDPGQTPFQGLQTLIKGRNAFTHFKLIDQLGLRSSAGRESLETVSSMVRELAGMEKRPEPAWIANDWCSALDMEL